MTMEPWLISVGGSHTVYWSAMSHPAIWSADDLRSMPADRFLRYGINGGRLGRRRRRERRALWDHACRERDQRDAVLYAGMMAHRVAALAEG